MRAKADLELENGRGGGPYFDALKELRAGIRTQVAALLGVSDDHLALTTSTTHGCQIVLAGLGIAPGDEIVTTDEEHFGLLGPLQASGATVRVANTRGETAERALELLLAEVGPRTRLVAISARVVDDRPPTAGRRAEARRPTCRCSSTVRSRSARSRSR